MLGIVVATWPDIHLQLPNLPWSTLACRRVRRCHAWKRVRSSQREPG